MQTTTMTRNSYNYIKNPVKKMGKGPEQTFFQRRHTKGRQAREKRLTITQHQGNANENHEEAPPPPCWSHALRPAPLQVLRPPPVEKQANSEDTHCTRVLREVRGIKSPPQEETSLAAFQLATVIKRDELEQREHEHSVGTRSEGWSLLSFHHWSRGRKPEGPSSRPSPVPLSPCPWLCVSPRDQLHQSMTSATSRTSQEDAFSCPAVLSFAEIHSF